ncbi:uncharacterized protein LOC119084521 [Bradysia coprophila]|uniref:uncharacterized protein LOC119084521 n=1 Tax=Bradysia coprophila TaxID=38358 RepID=UPI00187DD2F2|nr:uncharacterized protein LOC119084521 [Bradysia coprophila]
MRSITVVVSWLLFGLTTKTICQLYTDDVSDGRCTLNPVVKNFTSCLNLAIPQVFTVNYASNSLYRNYAESFLGRPANDQAELDAQCFTFAIEGLILIQEGYDKANIRSVIPTELDPTAPLLTDPLGLGKFKIETTFAQSPGSTVKNQYVTIDQAVWCDTKHVLLVRCVNETRQDWKLASIGNPEQWVKPIVLDVIESLGMSRENAIDYTGENGGPSCPVAPDLVTYKLRAAKRIGIPLPFDFGKHFQWLK